MRLHRVAVVLVGLLLSSCAGPIPVSELGRGCSGVGDRLAPSYYFGEVDLLVRLDSRELAEATRSAPVADTASNVVAVLGTPLDTVFDDGAARSLTALWMDPATRGETERLPEGLSVLLAIRQPSQGFPGEAWVQFVAVPTADGGLAFVGDCADRFYRAPLERYRDALRPADDLESVFIDVIADEGEWAEFEAFELG